MTTPIIILHGLFGSSKNWASISKLLAQRVKLQVHPIDLLNHGDAPWTEKMDWDDTAKHVHKEIIEKQKGKAHIIAHSLGGKIAMHLALQYPEVVQSLMVIDIAPMKKNVSGEFQRYAKSMMQINGKVKTKKEADVMMQEDVPDLSIRQFLLTNLTRKTNTHTDSYMLSSAEHQTLVDSAHHKQAPEEDDGHLYFKPNLRVLDHFIRTTLPGFPLEHSGKQYNGPSMLLSGSLSNYVDPSMYPHISRLFPRMRYERLECGHWVHAEKTKEFVDIAARFYHDQ